MIATHTTADQRVNGNIFFSNIPSGGSIKRVIAYVNFRHSLFRRPKAVVDTPI